MTNAASPLVSFLVSQLVRVKRNGVTQDLSPSQMYVLTLMTVYRASQKAALVLTG